MSALTQSGHRGRKVLAFKSCMRRGPYGGHMQRREFITLLGGAATESLARSRVAFAQYLLLEAMREVHWAPGPFNGLGEFPAEQPNDLPLSPTAQAFYRSGATLWQRYTSFWLTSLLNRIAFFVIPVIAALIPIIGFALSIYRWLYVRRLTRSERSTPGG